MQNYLEMPVKPRKKKKSQQNRLLKSDEGFFLVKFAARADRVGFESETVFANIFMCHIMEVANRSATAADLASLITDTLRLNQFLLQTITSAPSYIYRTSIFTIPILLSVCGFIGLHATSIWFGPLNN